MDRSRTSLRRRALGAAGALAVALVASSCSGGVVGTPAAATVDGVDISQDDVTALVEANAEIYQQQIDDGLDTTGQLADALDRVSGAGPGSVGRDGAAEILTEMIDQEVLRQELERLDALPTDELVQTVRDEIAQSAGGEEALAEFPEVVVEFAVQSESLDRAYREVLAAEANAEIEPPTEEERQARVLELYETVVETRPLCLNLILVATEDEAAAALARIEGGEAFGDVAAEVSIEPQSAADGGFAGCSDYEGASTAFGADLQGAAVGDLAGPLPAQTGAGETQFVVLEVARTDGPTLEEAQPQIDAAIDAETGGVDPSTVDAETPLLELVAAADITVDPRYGTWDPETLVIEPPAAPADPDEPVAETIPTITATPAPEE